MLLLLRLQNKMRRQDREVTDIKKIMEFAERGTVLHIGMQDQEGLYVVPLDYAPAYEEGKLVFYIHSAQAGRKYACLKKEPQVFVEMSIRDGLIIKNKHTVFSTGYRCIMGEGKAELVTNLVAKTAAIKKIVACKVSDVPEFSQNVLEHVAVFRIVLDRVTAKQNKMPENNEVPLSGNIYRHFKGNLYKVIGSAKHSETGEDMVVYQPLYGEGGLWVRPAKMFYETVEVDGKTVPRFAKIKEE